jgi:potassium efflux system protein
VASDQTVAFLRLFFNLGIVLVLYSFWSSVIPLAAIMDTVPLHLFGGLSLLQLAKAVLMGIVTFIAVRNLPGFLELSVLRTSTIETGTRNAISTLCQYAMIGLGLIALSNILHLDWAKVGWMAAALSVGLGFGLQEVVANFVCGLIVLFERPIRVGDVVTIEGTTGTVTNINMRATTITNWDRQDFVVPNKNLITGTILNWTLSSSINRVVIPVGIAYGSDSEKARQILLEVASEHPNVLDDPEPIACFQQFGASSKSLVLRAYLPDLSRRVSTITELHTEIEKRLAEARIEIPYPQQDLHLRTGWDRLGQENRRDESLVELGKRH